jgi:hypothetical protein
VDDGGYVVNVIQRAAKKGETEKTFTLKTESPEFGGVNKGRLTGGF